MAETVNVTTGGVSTATGSAGMKTQAPGQAVTVSGAAAATDGAGPGKFVETDIDEELFQFSSDDTPLMNLMLKAKKVAVDSPIVEHYMLDESRCSLTAAKTMAASTGQTTILQLPSEDQAIPQPYDTILVKGVDGYDKQGVKTPGKDLLLFVSGKDEASGNPIVRAFNGPKTQSSDLYCKVPEIKAGTKMVVMANALYETQKEVAPDLFVPQPFTLCLQKRGMNTVVSDYFEHQKKRIPFSQALIAEAAIRNFKTRGNRTLWTGRNGHIKVMTKLGPQDVYSTEGIRWQFKKELQHTGRWTFEEFVGLAKMFYTGEDVPSTALCLCGKNFLENIQCIDFSKHPEVVVTVKTNKLGWEVTNIHTVFGDLQFKREPTLDRLGYSNSCAIIGEDRLVHYVYKSESTFDERVVGEEAKRSGVIVWDGVALKGSCHIWVDGEGEGANADSVTYVLWSKTTAPDVSGVTTGKTSSVYYLIEDVEAIAANAKKGTLWYYDGTMSSWKEYTGTVTAE